MSEPSIRPVTATDFLGRQIRAGQTICYPVRRGSAMWLKKLRVQLVQDTPKGPCISGLNDTGRRINIFNLESCVIVEV